jgi:hypothetical protein
MSDFENDTHDDLVLAYLEYFKANEKFEQRKSYRTRAAARRALRHLRELAKTRMDEIQEDYNTKKEGND